MKRFNESNIVYESRHQFIYRKPSAQLSDTLVNLQQEYPVSADKKEPMVVYVDDFILPNINPVIEIDKVIIQRIATEYLNFSIASSIMQCLLKNNECSLSKKREEKFINKINRLYISDTSQAISTLEELQHIINEMQNFYKCAYISYLETGKFHRSFLGMPMTFLLIDHFAKDVKSLLNSNSCFTIIFDVRTDVPLINQQAINNLVASRINSDLSIKVICDHEMWKSYYDMQGQFIQCVHDYEAIYIEEEAHSLRRELINMD